MALTLRKGRAQFLGERLQVDTRYAGDGGGAGDASLRRGHQGAPQAGAIADSKYPVYRCAAEAIHTWQPAATRTIVFDLRARHACELAVGGETEINGNEIAVKLPFASR